jgi:hypothetical protein
MSLDARSPAVKSAASEVGNEAIQPEWNACGRAAVMVASGEYGLDTPTTRASAGAAYGTPRADRPRNRAVTVI